MSTVSSEFLDLMSQYQADMEKQSFNDDWSPPGSPSGIRYDSLLSGVDEGVKEDPNTHVRSGWVRLKFRILDGEYAGKEFSQVYSTKALFRWGPLFDLASMISGDPSHTQAKDAAFSLGVIKAAQGNANVRVCAKTRTDKKGQTFTNFNYDTVLSTVA